MSSRLAIPKNQWTVFWNTVGIFVHKPSRFLKNYRTSTDVRKLVRIGVSQTAIENVLHSFELYYKEPNLQFHKFCSFYRRDPDTASQYLNGRDKTDAFSKLFRKLHYNSFTEAKGKFQDIHLLHELNRKGEGRSFVIAYKGQGSIDRIQTNIFSGLLSSKDPNSPYEALKKFKFGRSTIIPIKKKSGGQGVYKFIKLTRDRNKVWVNISVDSIKEINLVKYKLSEIFASFVDTPEMTANFDNLVGFLKSGETPHNLLTGITYSDLGFKISLQPRFGLRENIATYPPHKARFARKNASNLDEIFDFRIFNKEIPTRNLATIRFLTYHSGGLIGALMLQLDDRRLNSQEREKIKADFQEDFGITLNQLLNFDNVSDIDIYRTLLENQTKRKRNVELRSDSAIQIYKKLVEEFKIISLKFDSTEKACFCFDRNCRLKYQRKWNQKYCRGCGGVMLNDKKFIVENIDEKTINDFVFTTTEKLGFVAEKLERRLINRKIYLTEVRSAEKSIIFIPITKPLSDNQIEVLRFRYPTGVIITSKGDHDYYETKEISAIELFQFVYDLRNMESVVIQRKINQLHRQKTTKVRALSTASSGRLISDTFYRDKNGQSKNFGAELFEADCSVLLNYIFMNSIWLGARMRGSAYPDGITAFPLLGTQNGCFLWDTKFGEGSRVTIGTDDKNLKYLKDAKSNPTIKGNGGLKGYVFISNTGEPTTFIRSAVRIIGNRRIKMIFITSQQLLDIFNHYKDHEDQILRNSRIRNLFIESIKKIFFGKATKRKGLVLKQDYLNSLLTTLEAKYATIATPRVNAT